MPASLSRISFNTGDLYTDMISALLSLARSSHINSLALGTRRKLLHYSNVSSMPMDTIICCFCSLPSFSFRGSLKHIHYSPWGHLVWPAVILDLLTNHAFKTPNFWTQKYHWIHCLFLQKSLTCLFVCCFVSAGYEIIWHVWISII